MCFFWRLERTATDGHLLCHQGLTQASFFLSYINHHSARVNTSLIYKDHIFGDLDSPPGQCYNGKHLPQRAPMLQKECSASKTEGRKDVEMFLFCE